jgi:hypothetical protein
MRTLTLILLILLSFDGKDTEKPDVVIDEGWLSGYAQEPTDHTISYRLGTGDIQHGFDVYIAVLDCDRLSETGTIEFSDGTRRSYQVFDCAQRGDSHTYSWMEDNNIVAELDYYSWEEHGLGRAKLLK